MDGITWSSRTSATNNNWVSVTYGNGLFVAVSDTGSGNRVMTSPDGITWTLRASTDFIDGRFISLEHTRAFRHLVSHATNDWSCVCWPVEWPSPPSLRHHSSSIIELIPPLLQLLTQPHEKSHFLIEHPACTWQRPHPGLGPGDHSSSSVGSAHPLQQGGLLRPRRQ